MEEGELLISSGLKINDPFRPKPCRFGDLNCIVETGKDCASMGIVYEITCKECNNKIDQDEEGAGSRKPGGQKAPNYIGMTMTSSHCRMVDHLIGQKAKRDSNPLYHHDRDFHQGEKQEYVTRVIAREQRLLPLTIMEALYIEQQVPGTSINDRNKYGRGNLVKISASRGVM